MHQEVQNAKAPQKKLFWLLFPPLSALLRSFADDKRKSIASTRFVLVLLTVVDQPSESLDLERRLSLWNFQSLWVCQLPLSEQQQAPRQVEMNSS